MTNTLKANSDAVTITPDSGTSVVVAQVLGTFSGTLNFEMSGDGVTWTAINGYPLNSTTGATTATTTGIWRIGKGGIAQVRVRMSSYVSGAAIVTLNSGYSDGTL